MKRFFVIGTNPTTLDQTASIQTWLRGLNTNWWHWINGTWLIVSNDPEITPAAIRDKLNDLAPKVHALVLEVEPITWSGFGPKSEKRNMFKWIRANWTKKRRKPKRLT